ncbi:5'-nucleotidase domain-containing protein 1 [Calliphora vicina]|uniref:5'-nucleotidase domain-containing protein 1 n=1 Tax=Calliphora vicina TaxID=7373 RepID=UPI00325B5A3D
MFCLNVRCLQNSAKLEKILFTLGKLRNNASLTTAAHHSTTTTNINKSHTAIGRQQMSRYSANTIMPHFKEFRLMDYDIIGFDLDGTLLRYDLNNMVPLEHDLLKEFLVNEKNYPKELLKQKFERNFLQKGLMVDTQRGNILKLSSDGTILKAAHGTRFMNDKEICEVYGESRQWDVAQEYIKDPLSAWNGPIAEKLRTLLDYFDIGASLVFAQAIDVLDETSSSSYEIGKNDYKVWSDMLAGLIQIYTREHFATGESAYFEALKGNPDKYLLKTDNKVIELLLQLKASGKALYLLTGSNIDFANFTASYALGPQWRELFDYTIGFAKKPGFFFAQRPFLQISNLNEVEGSELSLTEDLIPNTSYSQGNWQQLKESLCKNILNKDPKLVRSLYVGDNLIQDVYTPNAIASIDTIALSEELLENDNNYDFKTIVQSSLWGSYFSYNGTPTLWANFIEKYSQLCVSQMDVVAQYPLKEKIHCENKEGFFPKQPEGLSLRN